MSMSLMGPGAGPGPAPLAAPASAPANNTAYLDKLDCAKGDYACSARVTDNQIVTS